MQDNNALTSSTRPRTYQHFVDSLRDTDDAGLMLSPRRFTEALHIDLQTLAELAHVHFNAIAQAPYSRSVQDFMREALRVIKEATELNGDIDTALFWYRNEPLPTFAFCTAERLLSEGRSEDVLRYLLSLQAGAAE